MARDFYIISLKKNEKTSRAYVAEINFQGRVEKYEIRCNIGTKIRFNSPLIITVDDSIPEQEDDLQMRVRGVTYEGKRREKALEGALREYALEQ
jgi:hypothetical protein